MKGDIGVIRTFCNPWPKDDPKRYYVKFWEKKFDDKLSAYYHRHNIESADKRNQIHVFFDDEGILKITQCNDPELCYEIQCYVENLYHWEMDHNKDIQHCGYSVPTLLVPYITELDNGFRQIRYRGAVINVSPQQFESIGSLYADCYRTPYSMVINIDSKIPRLDDFIRSMISNGDIYPIKGCNDMIMNDFHSIFE